MVVNLNWKVVVNLTGFSSPSVSDSSKNIKIDKFYIFGTNDEVRCDEIKKMFYKFSNSRFGIHKIDLKFDNSFYKEFKTTIIDSANVLIWVKTVPGELEGHYEGGSRAIRLNNEINFIEIKTNKVYKKVLVKCIGEPVPEVREGHTEKSKDYYFGSYSMKDIAKIVEKEISKSTIHFKK